MPTRITVHRRATHWAPMLALLGVIVLLGAPLQLALVRGWLAEGPVMVALTWAVGLAALAAVGSVQRRQSRRNRRLALELSGDGLRVLEDGAPEQRVLGPRPGAPHPLAPPYRAPGGGTADPWVRWNDVRVTRGVYRVSSRYGTAKAPTLALQLGARRLKLIAVPAQLLAHGAYAPRGYDAVSSDEWPELERALERRSVVA